MSSKIPHENMPEAFNRLYVYLYLKWKGRLTHEQVIGAHTRPNDPIPLSLTDDQIHELIEVIKPLQDNNEKIATDIFHQNILELNDEIKLWEKQDKIIYYGNVQKKATSPAGHLERVIPTLLDPKRIYTFNTDTYWARNINARANKKNLVDNNIAVFNSRQSFQQYLEGEIISFEKNLYIILNYPRLQPYIPIKSNGFMTISFIKDAFSEGKMLSIHPRLGFIIQKMYPQIWSKCYWLPDVDDVDRITILTLQGAAFLRSNETNKLYERQSTFFKKELYAFEESELNTLILNQVWALSKNEIDYSKRVKNKDYSGVRYKNILDLNKLPSFTRYDLILIRHAESCANIWKSKSKLRQLTYRDPEITESGIQTSLRLSGNLQKKINELWKNEPYSVCASQMIRTQETAYYMTKKPINIVPHVAEDGITLDNFAFTKEKQRGIMGGRNPKILEYLDKGIDSREKQTFKEKSSWTAFLKWAENNPKSFSIGSDGVYRAVVFTHSHFLINTLGLKNRVKNNNGYIVTVGNGTITSSNKLDIGETINIGPDKCRISPYKETLKVPHVKRKRSSHNTRKACKKFMDEDDLLDNQGTYKTHLLNLISYAQKST
jgi:broad specificity phosphatase PhoE